MWWTALISLLTKIGEFLLSVYQKKKVVKQVEEKQDARDKLEANPADWFNDHFGGVRGNTTETADRHSMSAAAGVDPDKANPSRDRDG